MSQDPLAQPTAAPSTSLAGSLLFSGLVRTAHWRERRGLRRVWRGAFDLGFRTVDRPVRMRLHGRPSVMNFGYAYPIFAAAYPSYNQPLVDVVQRARVDIGRPVSFVDVGAAVGDTVLLLVDRLGADALGDVVCVDGDHEFVGYLRSNLSGLEGVTVVEALLSRDYAGAPSLIRTHPGTASAQGAGTVPTTTLDHVLAGRSSLPDVVKVDTDGFDGAVLAGGRRTLTDHLPLVVAEWHPGLLQRTANPLLELFEVLRSCGYDRFRLSDRWGHPAVEQPDDRELEELARRACAEGDGDGHYDVTAWSTAQPRGMS